MISEEQELEFSLYPAVRTASEGGDIPMFPFPGHTFQQTDHIPETSNILLRS